MHNAQRRVANHTIFARRITSRRGISLWLNATSDLFCTGEVDPLFLSPVSQTIVFVQAVTTAMSQSFDNTKEMAPVSSGQFLFTLDLAGNFCSVNKATEDLTGYRAGELTRMNVLDLLPGKCTGDLREIAAQSVRQRIGTVFEMEITASDRRRIALEVSLDLARRADGSLEFRGIAVLKDDAASWRIRPRCLDQQFRFKPSLPMSAELHAGAVARPLGRAH